MRSALIGTRVRFQLWNPLLERKGGFTLVEALVALAIIASVFGTLGSVLFSSRRIIVNADQRVAATALLRSLLDTPLDRTDLYRASRDGQTGGLSWRVTTERIRLDLVEGEDSGWEPFRVSVVVSWAPEQAVSAVTLRLGRKAKR